MTMIMGGAGLTAAEIAAAIAAAEAAAATAGTAAVGAGAAGAGAGALGAAEGAGAGAAGMNLAEATAPLDAMGGVAPGGSYEVTPAVGAQRGMTYSPGQWLDMGGNFSPKSGILPEGVSSPYDVPRPAMPPGMGAPPSIPMPESPSYADIGMFKDPSLTQSSPMDALLNTDWDAAVGKATGYLKFAKAAGDLGSLMKGEPKQDQKLSTATAPLNQQQPQSRPFPTSKPELSLPSTNLVPQGGMTQEDILRMRMQRGY